MDYLATCEDNAFELAIVDPPYGIGESGETNHTRGKLAKPKKYKAFAGGDKSAPSEQYFAELERVSKNQILWGANHYRARESSAWIVGQAERRNALRRRRTGLHQLQKSRESVSI